MTTYHKSGKTGGERVSAMRNYQRLHVRDIASLKSYDGKKYKLTYFKVGVRQAGFELESKPRVVGVNDEKLDSNISRARSRVYEYAMCNPWQHFVTLTLNKKSTTERILENSIETLANGLEIIRRSMVSGLSIS